MAPTEAQKNQELSAEALLAKAGRDHALQPQTHPTRAGEAHSAIVGLRNSGWWKRRGHVDLARDHANSADLAGRDANCFEEGLIALKDSERAQRRGPGSGA